MQFITSLSIRFQLLVSLLMIQYQSKIHECGMLGRILGRIYSKLIISYEMHDWEFIARKI